jgi:TrmH family RNA methyltransferase
MKTMGIHQLYLVSPRTLIDASSHALAAGATDILSSAVFCNTLPEALAECTQVFAFSARRRDLSPTFITARVAAETAATNITADGEVALLFGGERSGLTNEDMGRAGYAVEIPTSSEYFSLNLSQAVQIAVYELRQALTKAPRAPQRDMPSQMQMEMFFTHCQEVLDNVNMPKRGDGGLLLARLRRLITRAEPDAAETRMLRGVLRAVQRRIMRADK